MLLLSIIFPAVWGLAMFFLPAFRNRKTEKWAVVIGLVISLALALAALTFRRGIILPLAPGLRIYFRPDGVSRLMVPLFGLMWLLSGVFSLEYMHHEKNHSRYYGFFFLTLAALFGLGLSANYLTMYLCFEAMTVLSFPMVLHRESGEAVAAAKKYLLYSVAGACLGLLGMAYLGAGAFISGGRGMNLSAAGSVIVFLTVAGFGAKAEMFPFHGWLPQAYPVAPTPASAVLSSVITKAGVLAILRVIYYVVGPEALRGTWMQYGWLALALLTVIMGSAMAYQEQVLKRRLAYSTASQVSYILFGLFLLDSVGLTGALLHVVFHSIIKNCLFFACGAIIFHTGKTRVEELRGIGREMPFTMGCYTIAALGLIGIPPMCGFVSKWYLAVGSLGSGIPVISWLGPVVLLASALLTAGYLFSITIRGFFPGADYQCPGKRDCGVAMGISLGVLAVLTALLGMFPELILNWIRPIIASVL